MQLLLAGYGEWFIAQLEREVGLDGLDPLEQGVASFSRALLPPATGAPRRQRRRSGH
jgi:hypothetical protein